MTEMADKIAAVKASHILAPAALLAMAAAEPHPSKHRMGMKKTHCYSAKQWQAMRKRRKQARAARRRNRRG